MTNSFKQLPWRLAALAAAIVGGASIATGCDIWPSLARAGAGFAVFWALGIPLRRFFQMTSANGADEDSGNKPEEDADAPEEISVSALESSDIPGDDEE